MSPEQADRIIDLLAAINMGLKGIFMLVLVITLIAILSISK